MGQIIRSIYLFLIFIILLNIISMALAQPGGGGPPGGGGNSNGGVGIESSSHRPNAKSSSSGESSPICYLKVSSNSDKREYYRDDYIRASYEIDSKYINDIKIGIPLEFEFPKIVNSNAKNSIIIDGKIKLELDSATSTSKTYLAYVARISKDARLNGDKKEIDICADKINAICDSKNIYNHRIIIKNNLPELHLFLNRSDELNKKGVPDISLLETRSVELFKDEISNLELSGNDIEDSNLSYELSIIIDGLNQSLSKGYLNNSLRKEFKSVVLPSSGSIELNVNVSDKDGGYFKNKYLIKRNNNTISKYIANRMILSFFLLSLILLGSLFIKRYFGNLLKLLFIIFVMLFILLILSIPFDGVIGWFREVAIFEVWVYIETFILFAIFIQSNFISQYHKDEKYIIQTESLLWGVSASSMGAITLLFIFVLPGSSIFGGLGSNADKFNYIFWYYSMMPQTFGAILAVVVAFTGWYLEEKKLTPSQKEEFKNKIKSFIILYMSIIVLSVIGLVNGTIPPLGNLIYVASSLSELISIITLQCTLLLMIPAFSGLFELAKWTMELNKNNSNYFGNFDYRNLYLPRRPPPPSR